MATATKAIPFIVPAQPSPQIEAISQNELGLLLSLRGRLHQLQSQVDAAEQSIKERLQHRAGGVEPGDHVATLATSYRRNASWKRVTERLADRLKLDGKAFAARVLAATKPTPVVSLDIH